jgi:hypothetical protein
LDNLVHHTQARRDADGDGKAELKTPFLTGLNSPFGMVLIGEKLYVANTDGLVVFPYKKGDTKITAKGKELTKFNAMAPNNHWTRNLAASPDGVTDEFEKVNMTCAPNRISPGTEDGGDVRTRLKKHFVSS